MSIAAVEADILIRSVRFDGERLVVELSDGRTLGAPVVVSAALGRDGRNGPAGVRSHGVPASIGRMSTRT